MIAGGLPVAAWGNPATLAPYAQVVAIGYALDLSGGPTVTSGTVSSHRVRGYTRPSYNVLEITSDEVRVTLKYPGTGERVAGVLDRRRMALATNPELAAMFTKSTWRP